MNELRNLPSVEKIIQYSESEEWISKFGRHQTLRAIRETLDFFRSEIKSGKNAPDHLEISNQIQKILSDRFFPTLIPVINATGVVLHTNLGRAPLSHETIRSMQSIGSNYSTLEFSLSTGKRGSRSVHTEEILKQLTGAEAAIVVNNNAAAVLLVLSALAKRKNVIIARSQLIEIGGGFRIPDVMKQSGAKLKEVGTTNRVRVADYEQALQESAALVMRAHHSNFKITGFTQEPNLREIVEISHQFGIPVMDDLGSGTFLDTSEFGLSREPTIFDSIQADADIVSFSGDKLLGGPQAGIIIGKSVFIQKIKNHPLARVIRPDKICLAGLTATLTHYLRNEAVEKIPVWQMISRTSSSLETQAKFWQQKLKFGELLPSLSTIGGGSLPEETLPTFVLAVEHPKPDLVMKKLRSLDNPIIARLEDNKILFDPRTVLPEQETAFILGLQKIFDGLNKGDK
ncbi:MAG: L-seryl-tRNA(Sec) selenium transferase [Chloroflexi bacterium HGW-Chloroflexi-3]|nr:MAG: L-seryl-tRNA(Sec) selenium transferase [Chloroflexi bacterium HGW-Chloroflexi-3]